MQVFDFQDAAQREALKAAASTFGLDEETAARVRELLDQIRAEGDVALLRLTERFDRAKLTPEALRIPENELIAAEEGLTPTQAAALEEAIRCVSFFHQKTLPNSWTDTNPQGAMVGERFYPIRRVGLYIPGGSVPLVSTVIMTATLAKIAGCQEIAVCTPPQANGSVSPGLLAALAMSDIREVYKLGGVQAIGAMAFGTDTVPAVDKIFGPGNAYVMEAKRQLFGVVGIDLLPGPSEVLIIADDDANPAGVAADLLAQAEHGSGKEKVYLVAFSNEAIEAVQEQVRQQTPACTHAVKIAEVMENRAVAVLVSTREEAAAVANYLAPEHLELHASAEDLEFYRAAISTAGAMLMGGQTPTVLGDFTAGPSHTLPTDRTGRFLSGLQVSDFMRRTSFVEYNDEALKKAWPVVKTLAELEQLDAHGESLRMRIAPPADKG